MGKRKISRYKLGIALAFGLAPVALGVAQAETPPAPAAAGSSLEQRIAQRKTERGTMLEQKDLQRIVSTCTRAQTKLRSMQTKEVSVLDKRAKVYAAIDANIWIAVGQLKLAEQDTFDLEKQRVTLADYSTSFSTLAANYKQAIDDALLINCKADPVGFKALVDTARIYNDQLRTQSKQSRDHIINTVKPGLKSFASELESKPASSEAN